MPRRDPWQIVFAHENLDSFTFCALSLDRVTLQISGWAHSTRLSKLYKVEYCLFLQHLHNWLNLRKSEALSPKNAQKSTLVARQPSNAKLNLTICTFGWCPTCPASADCKQTAFRALNFIRTSVCNRTRLPKKRFFRVKSPYFNKSWS